jgi:hypothetical protein
VNIPDMSAGLLRAKSFAQFVSKFEFSPAKSEQTTLNPSHWALRCTVPNSQIAAESYEACPEA